MRVQDLLTASLIAPFVVAHGDHIPGAPRIFGRNPFAELKSWNVFNEHAARDAQPAGPKLAARQGGTSGACGPSTVASGGGTACDAGYCCSPSGWCGNTEEYCTAPDCLIDYGPGCDANKTPAGATTKNIDRTKVGSVTYDGAGIYACTTPGTLAITFDDGPYIYTNGVLDTFASYNAKATFFITGNNNGKGEIDNETLAWPAVIRRMISEGHQVASHTWSHQDLSLITAAQRQDQIIKNEMAFRNIIGKIPTYMRPPYSSCTVESGCQQDLSDLGYHVSYFNLDTDDYDNTTPDKIQNAKDNFSKAVTPASSTTDEFLTIAHDIHQQTAQNLTGYMLSLASQKGFKLVTMGECMGDPQENWYRSANTTATSSSASASGSATSKVSATVSTAATATGKVSTDGTCGGTNGYTCTGSTFGNCCSQYGWCGSTADHCDASCNASFGTCTKSSASATVSAVATSSPTSGSKTISSDGSCGGTAGNTCVGSTFGNCCSQYGYCGSTTDYCGTGCNSGFGSCTATTRKRAVAFGRE